MANQTYDLNRERGGVPLRDYTLGGRSPALSGSRLKNLNFGRWARRLAWFGLGLGLAEAFFPKQVQKLVGVKGDRSLLIRTLGLREILAGMLIFMEVRPHLGSWARVAGDAMDLACLGAALTSSRSEKNQVGIATASVIGITALDVLTSVQLTRKESETRQSASLNRSDLSGRRPGGAFYVTKSIVINSTPETLYSFWRNFENLPQFMFHLKSVQVMDDKYSHWVAKAPANTKVEWDAEVTEDRPDQLIAWQSTSNAEVPNMGVVRFQPTPNGRGTIVQVEIEYRPPAGAIGKIVAKLFGEAPSQQVAGDLNRFKQVIETGEVVRSDGSPEGYGQKMQRPGRPMTEKELAAEEKDWSSSPAPRQVQETITVNDW